mgnify:CR=1 FL=1
MGFWRFVAASVVAFFLLYRFAEAQLVKMAAPFLLDGREQGGLGLTTTEVGFIYGTIGVKVWLCKGEVLDGKNAMHSAFQSMRSL